MKILINNLNKKFMKKTQKLITIIIVMFSITTYIGCKKEILDVKGSTPTNNSNRYSEDIFSEPRSYENAILAIEYELNMEVADTNMLSGATEYGNVSIDSFYFDSYTFTANEVSTNDQSEIYSSIRDIILDSLIKYYDTNQDGNSFIIDLSVDDFNENIILVKFAHAAIINGCDCSFTTNLEWSDLNINNKDCNYLDDKINNYYANCIEVRPSIGRYYDFILETLPNNGFVYFTGSDITNATQTLVNLDQSMTPNEQIVTRDYLYNFWFDYADNQTDGRNELLKVYIGGTIGSSYTLYLDHLVRSKYSSNLPF